MRNNNKGNVELITTLFCIAFIVCMMVTVRTALDYPARQKFKKDLYHHCISINDDFCKNWIKEQVQK